jgi:hypothetical protein
MLWFGDFVIYGYLKNGILSVHVVYKKKKIIWNFEGDLDTFKKQLVEYKCSSKTKILIRQGNKL